MVAGSEVGMGGASSAGWLTSSMLVSMMWKWGAGVRNVVGVQRVARGHTNIYLNGPVAGLGNFVGGGGVVVIVDVTNFLSAG